MELATRNEATIRQIGPGRLDPIRSAIDTIVRGANALAPVFDLGIRGYVASVFIQSGLTKIASWDATLALFEEVYSVPVLAPEVAAYLGTAAELLLPIPLLLGIGGRFAALALFVFNLVAVFSYPEISEAGIKDHQLWGVLLVATLVHGPGRLSLDHLIRNHFTR